MYLSVPLLLPDDRDVLGEGCFFSLGLGMKKTGRDVAKCTEHTCERNRTCVEILLFGIASCNEPRLTYSLWVFNCDAFFSWDSVLIILCVPISYISFKIWFRKFSMASHAGRKASIGLEAQVYALTVKLTTWYENCQVCQDRKDGLNLLSMPTSSTMPAMVWCCVNLARPNHLFQNLLSCVFLVRMGHKGGRFLGSLEGRREAATTL